MHRLGPIETWSRDGPKGYILEVDVCYPLYLHDQHNDLPFLCEKATPPGGRVSKLMCTLNDKTKYVVHYRALQQALEHGLLVTKLHRVICFSQMPWMRSYVNENTERRKMATNKAESDAQKLYNNAAYGKTLENKRNRIKLNLVSDQYKLMKLIASPRFLDRTVLNDNLVSVIRSYKEVELDKPIYVGLTVLDLSKLLMYEFHYDKMVKWFGRKNVSLMYMDTDSFVYEIKSNDLVRDLMLHKDEFDFSNYPSDHPLYDVKNDKVLGKMKDELGGKRLTRFVGLRPKSYAMDIEGFEIKKAKGVGRAAVKKRLHFDDYLRCLNEGTTLMASFSRIVSNQHIITTVDQRKLALSPFDDKRYVIPNSFSTMAHGHYRIDLDEDQLD